MCRPRVSTWSPHKMGGQCAPPRVHLFGSLGIRAAACGRRTSRTTPGAASPTCSPRPRRARTRWARFRVAAHPSYQCRAKTRHLEAVYRSVHQSKAIGTKSLKCRVERNLEREDPECEVQSRTDLSNMFESLSCHSVSGNLNCRGTDMSNAQSLDVVTFGPTVVPLA